MTTAKKLIKAAGAAGAAEVTYVDDVFSTYLYEGNGSTQTITNGIDLAGEGGLVWIKQRDTVRNHFLVDTERGVNQTLNSDRTNAVQNTVNSVTAFNSDGFSLGSEAGVNEVNGDFASWTFRKQPGFFDIVTYTGDGTNNRQISHNLGSTPGMIIIKKTSASGSWYCWHRNYTGAGLYLENATVFSGDTPGFNTSQSSTTINLSSNSTGSTNSSGATYVAYLFAHDAQDFGEDSDEAIIKCGSYTGNGSSTGPEINLGFEPQWLMAKRTDGTGEWWLVDNMRGMVNGANDAVLFPNASAAEDASDVIKLTSTGFQLQDSGTRVNANGSNYIYMAIRRPHKPASEFAATDLFKVDNRDTAFIDPAMISGFPVDMAIHTTVNENSGNGVSSRLTGGKRMFSDTNAVETGPINEIAWDFMDGYRNGASANANEYSWMWRRAPGFFDVVTYTGDGVSGRQIPHNLGAVPQLMITKIRSATGLWRIGFTPDQIWTNWGSSPGAWQANGNIYGDGTQWIDPTESVVTVHSGAATNQSGSNYIQYLFGTLPGISKVGKYTGTGSAQDIDCGFSGGARFVMITNYTNPDYFYVWDSERGIITGSADPRLAINSSSAQATTNDALNAYSGGFGVTSNVIANSSGDTYIFLAIA